MDDSASRTSEMKVLSLDVAFSRCDELERGLRKANGVRVAVPASFVVVLVTCVGFFDAFASSPSSATSAERAWFVTFFGLYGLAVIVSELRLRRRSSLLNEELKEVRRWTEG